MSRLGWALSLLSFCSWGGAAAAAAPFMPDPATVQRYGPAYRYPQAGWIVLHVEGEPYERGVQHGRLLAAEIAAHVRCFAALQAPKAPTEGWKLTRTLADALFLRRFHREFLEEMKGIADGASAAGAKFDGRPIDLLDIVTLNAWAEIDTLDAALHATPTGLEGVRFPLDRPKAAGKPQGEHCSAFAATGPATRDGKIVFGHITMFALYPANYYNVWLDIKPSRGHRVAMQSYPGGMQSGMDYYLNDAGLLVCETTIRQTKFDATGFTLASRIRQAVQYADSIDKAVAFLKEGNNGLYTNEWLLGDTKTNEIAMFELGTAKAKLWRSSRDEWFAGTEGFYWGCNNTKDLDVRLDTLPALNDRPGHVVFRPSDRDRKWLQLYDAHKGKIDADWGKLAFTTPPLCAYHSLDAKVTTTELAKTGQTLALFGPPLGRTWWPTDEEKQRYPEVRPLVGNEWAALSLAAPGGGKTGRQIAVDLPNPDKEATEHSSSDALVSDPPTRRAWRGTILPKSDGDLWLAAAFSRYERLRALEEAVAAKTGERGDGQERFGLELFGLKASYTLGARAQAEVAAAKVQPEARSDSWHRIAEGKGVLLLAELHTMLGAADFDRLMDEFGLAHSGKAVDTASFRSAAEKAAGKDLRPLFDFWLQQTGLPTLKLGAVSVAPTSTGYKIQGELLAENDGRVEGRCLRLQVKGHSSAANEPLDPANSKKTARGLRFTHLTRESPEMIAVCRECVPAWAWGGPFSVLTYLEEPEAALIVTGTSDEQHANREAAEALQQAIRARHSNVTVPIRTDREVTPEELSSRHVLLIGRPTTNSITERWRQSFGAAFGNQSVTVDETTYAHAESAVAVAAENPVNRRYSTVVIAGLSGAATLRAAPRLADREQKHGDALVFEHGKPPRSLLLFPKALRRDLRDATKQARK